jgi:RNA polymerase sigma-70 factor (ECF subfamily)
MAEERRSEDGEAFSERVKPLRRELFAYCYRMAGSVHDAEDLLQESLARAWAAYPGFEERATLRTWLYRIVSNVCVDALDKRAPRVLPPELGPPGDPGVVAGGVEPIWLEPYPEHLMPESGNSPDVQYTARESVALAFLTVLQRLPPRQRAALLLRDVLGWSASECAELLGSTVPAINSAVQRARESLSERSDSFQTTRSGLEDEGTRALLERYLRAWEDSDVAALVALLSEDAILSMPPLPMWFRGPEAIGQSLGQMILTPESRGHFRLLPTRANGLPAFATYRLDPATQDFRPLSIQVILANGHRIREIQAFLGASLFDVFGLPGTLTRA